MFVVDADLQSGPLVMDILVVGSPSTNYLSVVVSDSKRLLERT